VTDERWPLRFRVWKRLHDAVNDLAWRFQPPPRETVRALGHFPGVLWRLNDWLADRWVPYWMARR